MAKTVYVGKLPGKMTPVAIEQGTTVGGAIREAGLDAAGFEVRVNDEKVDDLTRQAEHSDSIYLTQKIKGNQITVNVGALPGRMVPVAIDEGASVADALRLAELSATGYELRVNDVTADLDTRLSDRDSVYLTQKIKGN